MDAPRQSHRTAESCNVSPCRPPQRFSPNTAPHRPQSGPPWSGLCQKTRRHRGGAAPPYVSTMILRPVRPASPSGPPMTNLPVGFTCHLVASVTQPSGNSERMNGSTIARTSSDDKDGSRCCDDKTMVSAFTGTPSRYCNVNWDFISGPKTPAPALPDLRASAKRANILWA